MIKIKNNLLIKNIFLLLISGGVAKILGMLGKVMYTRIAGINVVSLYALITPTFMLVISLIQFSFPISISKLSAEEKYNNKDLIKYALIIGFVVDIIISILIFLFSDIIVKLLHTYKLSLAIKTIIPIIPLVTVSSILRGFLHGKEDMNATSLTNVIEEVIKIILILLFLPIAVLKSDVTAVIFIILFNLITELFSIIILVKTINKKYVNDVKKESKGIIKDILKISVPTTLVRLISSFGFFLEPIILTNVLLSKGFSAEYITLEYGIINSYIIPLLSMPTFFSTSIASALLPNITKLYYNKKYKLFNSKLLKLMVLSIIIGLACLSIILLFPSQILKLVYNINLGINYMYIIGPFFLILYMQPTLSVAIQAMDKTNNLLLISIIMVVVKYTSLFVLCKNGFGINSFLYSIIIGILITTFLMFITVVKKLKQLIK